MEMKEYEPKEMAKILLFPGNYSKDEVSSAMQQASIYILFTYEFIKGIQHGTNRGNHQLDTAGK